MTTLFVRHRIQDYAKWREVYDGVAPMQKRAGVIAEAVYRADDDPNDLTVTHDFGSLAQARAFAESAALRDVMGRAGVLGTPTLWFATRT